MSPDQYLTVALALCLVILILYFWRKNGNLPPGPYGIPILGFFPFLSTRPYEQYVQLAKRYGNMFSFRSTGGKLVVVFNGFRTTKEVFVARAEELVGRPAEDNLVAWISDGFGVAQEEGAPWKDQRRFFQHSIKNYGFGKLEIEGQIQEQIQAMLDELHQANGEPVDMSLHISYAANTVISSVLFNKKFDNDPGFRGMCKGLVDLAYMFSDRNLVAIGWFFRYIVMNFFSGSKDARKAKKMLQHLIDEIIDDHVQSFDPDHPKDFVDAYLLQRTQLEKQGLLEKSTFTIPRLKGIASNMFFEGTESIAVAAVSFLRELCKHPDVQLKVQQELDSVVGRERMPSWLDKQDLPYLDAVIMELYRAALPFNTSTMYSNFEEISLQGYRIPKRSVLIVNLYSLNNDPQVYTDPSKFDPGRFLGPDGKRIKQEGPFTFGIAPHTVGPHRSGHGQRRLLPAPPRDLPPRTQDHQGHSARARGQGHQAHPATQASHQVHQAVPLHPRGSPHRPPRRFSPLRRRTPLRRWTPFRRWTPLWTRVLEGLEVPPVIIRGIPQVITAKTAII